MVLSTLVAIARTRITLRSRDRSSLLEGCVAVARSGFVTDAVKDRIHKDSLMVLGRGEVRTLALETQYVSKLDLLTRMRGLPCDSS